MYSDEKGESYYQNVEKKSIDLALTDKITGAILTAPKGSDRPFLYSPKGLQDLYAAERVWDKLWKEKMVEWDSKEMEFEPFYVSDIPLNVTEDEIDTFKGFVINPEWTRPVATTTTPEIKKEV